MFVRACAEAREMTAHVFKWFTTVCMLARACVCVREGLINDVSSANQVVYYIIVTERKVLQDEQTKFYFNLSGCACARERDR